MPTKRASDYSVPALAMLLGLIGFVAAWIGGEDVAGLLIFAVMAVYAAVLLTGGRFSVTRVLGGRPVDEREQTFGLRATAFAGVVVITCITGAFFYELARGGATTGTPTTLWRLRRMPAWYGA